MTKDNQLNASHFSAASLVVGGRFRISAGQGKNYRAVAIIPFRTDMEPQRTVLEVIAEGASVPLLLELDTILYSAK